MRRKSAVRIVVVWLVLFVCPKAGATVFSIDHLTVHLNGALYFEDAFDDGAPPPSGPVIIPAPARTPIYTAMQGIFTESGGKASFDTFFGTPALSNSGIPIRRTRARLNASTNSANITNLGQGDTFSASAVYDLVNPGPAGEEFRIGFTDGTATNTPNDIVILGVQRAAFGAASPFNSLNGQVVLRYREVDRVTGNTTTIAAVPVDLTGNPDQVRLTLTKAGAASNAITASYTYLKGGAELSTAGFADTTTIFTDESFTRPEIAGLRREAGIAPQLAAQLQAGPSGSPAGITQIVDTGASPFELTFAVLFESTSGALDVTLNGVALGTVSAPASLDGTFSPQNFLIDGALLDQSGAALAFVFSGLANASVLIDDIVFPDLANGDFQTGNLTAWESRGTARVVNVAAVPVPPALPLFLSALTLLAAAAWPRRNAGRRAGPSTLSD